MKGLEGAMNVIVLDKTLNYENEIEEVDGLLKEINEIVEQSNQVFSHLVIDGKAVYENHGDFIEGNIGNVEEIQVMTLSKEAFVKEIMISKKEYIHRAMPEMDKLANDFYVSPVASSWQGVNDLTGGLLWIIESYVLLTQNKKLKDTIENEEAWKEYQKSVEGLSTAVPDLEEAMNNKDHILVGDIISYELTESLASLEEKVEIIIKSLDVLEKKGERYADQ